MFLRSFSRDSHIPGLSIYSWGQDQARQMFSIVFGAAVAYYLSVCIYRLWFHRLSKFPGPPLLAVTQFPFSYLNYIRGRWIPHAETLHRKYGHVVRIGPNRLSLDGAIAWPEVVDKRAGQNGEYPKQDAFFYEGDDVSLLGASRDDHRRQRRQLNPAFKATALSGKESIITQYVSLLMQNLAKWAEKGHSVNVVDWMNFFAFDVIGHMTFSEPFHSLENNQDHPWVRSTLESLEMQARGRFLKCHPLLSRFVRAFRVLLKHDQTNKHQYYAVERTQARLHAGLTLPDQPHDLVATMLSTDQDGKSRMTEKEILATSPFLMIAGSESTGTTLAGFIFFLGSHHFAYETLAQEIRSAFDTEDDVTFSSLNSLEYLHACIKETLRLYPPVPEITPRVSPGDMIDGKYVPSKTIISISLWATFRNPDHFVEPSSFIPERWHPESHPRYDKKFMRDNPLVFKPFSPGPRDCIGPTLAYIEMKLVIAHLLHQFDFEIVPGQEDWLKAQRTFVAWKKGPLNVLLHRRL